MYIRINILLIIALLGNSCESFLDVNTDPNNPDAVTVEKVLPAAISSAAYVMGGKYQVLGSLWSQHYTQSPGASQYAGIDAYDVNSSSYDDNQFGELYAGALKAFEYVREESEKQEEWKSFIAEHKLSFESISNDFLLLAI